MIHCVLVPYGPNDTYYSDESITLIVIPKDTWLSDGVFWSKFFQLQFNVCSWISSYLTITFMRSFW